MEKNLPAPPVEGQPSDDICKFFSEGGSLRGCQARFGISYRKAQRYRTIWQQKTGADEKHHPKEKTAQVMRILSAFPMENPKILEVHGGHGYLTETYQKIGKTVSLTVKEGNDLHHVRLHLAKGKTYDIVDLDPYGYPTRILLSGVCELLSPRGILFVTFPQGRHFPSPILRGINNLVYATEQPSEEDVIRIVRKQNLLFHRTTEVLETEKMGGVLRFVFLVQRRRAQDIWTYKKFPEHLADLS